MRAVLYWLAEALGALSIFATFWLVLLIGHGLGG